ncbi:Microtubule-associated proteins 1A/1B light chain 3C, partial [Eschrichtius robustus]|nr:Microtubule-associated proteins 1A/1B light chain 3C [Eschrichtius robustus]
MTALEWGGGGILGRYGQTLAKQRSRMVLGATEAFYLLVNNRSFGSMNVTMAEIYRDYKDEDGFVYMTYASQMFGCLGDGPGGKAALQ